MRTPQGSKLVFLVGMTGAGKTTVGRRLADRLDRPFVDLDDLIELRTKTSVANVFAQHGEFNFRCCEAQVLRDIPRLQSGGAVVATGGGAAAHFGSMTFMRSQGLTIFLDASAPELISRLASKRTNRPMLNRDDWQVFLAETLARRRSVYQQAHVTVSVDGRMVGQILDSLERQLPQIVGH